MLLVAGDTPAARGFRLDGYGVFFDVEVPGVRPSLAWSLRTMNETAAMFARELQQVRAQLRQAVTTRANGRKWIVSSGASRRRWRRAHRRRPRRSARRARWTGVGRSHAAAVG